MIQPVGKSGAGIILNRSSSDKFLFFKTAMQPSTTSVKLCGGIDVAMPTAIPEVPLTKRFGTRDGKITGSTVDSSKFGTKSTVSFAMSVKSSAQIFIMRTSV